jgi:D-alanyl-D-alanine carboxypeptidase/D-alanyl-D-alanine-endopeptidase (penicillin-binding protein 4)
VVTSRVLLVALLVLVSIDTTMAQSQGSASGSGSATSEIDDEEGGGSGSGSALVAPKDPKERGKWLTEKLDAAIAARPLMSARSKIGVAIYDLATGTELYTRNGDTGLSLASNAKLLTTVAALGTLGGGFRWRTAVFIDDKSLDETTGTVKGNLYVRGRGDPTLTTSDLREIAVEIAARGVRKIDGKLVVDDSYFDGVVDPPHFNEQPKERAYFRAPIASFCVNRSFFTVHVIGQPGGPAKVWLDPDVGEHIKLTKQQVTTISLGRTRIKVDIKPQKGKPDVLEVEVSGQIRLSDGHWWAKRRVDDPIRFAAEAFRNALAAEGITIARKGYATGAIPLNARSLVAHDSVAMSSVIREMNKSSDNYFAETVLKTLGAESRATPAPASWADGHAAVQAFLAKLGLPPGTYRADNGSGLFNATEVSAKQMVTLLRGAHADYRIGPDLAASLPIGGMDGTLAKRFKNSPAKGRVRAKTGTLAAVATLAGYAGVDSKHPVAFAIFVNDIPTGQKPAARAMADDMLDAVVAYLEAANAP